MGEDRNFRGCLKKCLRPFVGGLAGFLWGDSVAGRWAKAWSWEESQGKDNQHQKCLFPEEESKLWASMGLEKVGDYGYELGEGSYLARRESMFQN